MVLIKSVWVITLYNYKQQSDIIYINFIKNLGSSFINNNNQYYNFLEFKQIFKNKQLQQLGKDFQIIYNQSLQNYLILINTNLEQGLLEAIIINLSDQQFKIDVLLKFTKGEDLKIITNSEQKKLYFEFFIEN